MQFSESSVMQSKRKDSLRSRFQVVSDAPTTLRSIPTGRQDLRKKILMQASRSSVTLALLPGGRKLGSAKSAKFGQGLFCYTPQFTSSISSTHGYLDWQHLCPATCPCIRFDIGSMKTSYQIRLIARTTGSMHDWMEAMTRKSRSGHYQPLWSTTCAGSKGAGPTRKSHGQIPCACLPEEVLHSLAQLCPSSQCGVDGARPD